MKKLPRLESIWGAADGSIEEFRFALSQGLSRYLPTVEGFPGEQGYAAICDTFESDVVFETWENGATRLWRVDYTYERAESAYSFSFSNLRRTNRSITFNDGERVDAGSAGDSRDVVVATESEKGEGVESFDDGEPITTGDPEVEKVSVLTSPEGVFVSESCEMVDGRLEVRLVASRILFESEAEDLQKTLETTGKISGVIPFADIGRYTANDNRYTEKFAAHLESDAKRLITSRRSGKKLEVASPWPPLVMFASHQPAKGSEGPERFFAITAQINGFERRGNWMYARVETTRNQAGRDMAWLFVDMPWNIPGVSLRGISREETANERGGHDVDWMFIETFGIDWTWIPAMPGIKDQEFTFESRESGLEEFDPMKIKNLKELKERLKESNPALYTQLLEAIAEGREASQIVTLLESAGERVVTEKEVEPSEDPRLVEANRIIARESVVALESVWRKKIEAIAEFSDDTRKDVMTSVSAILKRESDALVSTGVNPKGARFEGDLDGRTTDEIRARVDDVKSIIARARAEAKLSRPDTTETIPAGSGAGGVDSAPNLSLMDGRIRGIFEERALVGLPTSGSGALFESGDSRGEPIPPPLKDSLMAATFDTPMYVRNESGDFVHVIQHLAPEKWMKLEELKRPYYNPNDPYRPFIGTNGKIFPSIVELMRDENHKRIQQKIRTRQPLTESELTSATALGTLPDDFFQAVIEASFFMSAWATMATVRPVNSETFSLYEEEYRREGEHIFGVLDFSTVFANTGDELVMTYADKVYAKVVVAPNADTTITVTGLDQMGNTVYGTVTVLTTAVVGSYLQIRPTVNGVDFKDISTATHTGGTTGSVQFIAFDSMDSGSTPETTVSGNARVVLVERTGTVGELDCQAQLTWRLIENAARAFLQAGGFSWDAPSSLLRAITLDLSNQIDRRGFGGAVNSSNYDSTNNVSFNVSSSGIPAGYTAEEWKAELHANLIKLSEKIDFWSEGNNPDRLAINLHDKHKMLWMKGDFLRAPGSEARSSAFFQGLSWGTIAGMQVIPTRFLPHNVMMAAQMRRMFYNVYIPLEFRGPFSYLGSSKSDTWIARQRSGNTYIVPRSRGLLTITE